MKLWKAAGVMIVLFTGLKKWFHARSTIFVDVNNSMTVMQEETFGPVLCLMPFDTEEEALVRKPWPLPMTRHMDGQTASTAKMELVAMVWPGGSDREWWT
jgi:hypothetical protein